jgi:hypothetical protein
MGEFQGVMEQDLYRFALLELPRLGPEEKR